MKISVSLRPHQTLLLSNFLIIILLGVKYLTGVLICVILSSLYTTDSFVWINWLYLWGYFWAIYFVPLICIFLFHYHTILFLKLYNIVWNQGLWSLHLCSFSDCLGFSDSLVISYEFWNCLWKHHWNFDRIMLKL